MDYNKRWQQHQTLCHLPPIEQLFTKDNVVPQPIVHFNTTGKIILKFCHKTNAISKREKHYRRAKYSEHNQNKIGWGGQDIMHMDPSEPWFLIIVMLNNILGWIEVYVFPIFVLQLRKNPRKNLNQENRPGQGSNPACYVRGYDVTPQPQRWSGRFV